LLKSFDALGKALLAAPTAVAPLHSALEQWAQAGLAAIGVPRMGALPPATQPAPAQENTVPAAAEEVTQVTPQRTPCAAAQGSPAEEMLSPAWWARAPPPRAAEPEVEPLEAQTEAPPSPQPAAAAAAPPATPLPAAASGCCVIS
jgi:hypothetical protein